MQHYKLKFRPDIEGLRALAIILVVLEHADSRWLPGGFIGVDIFFVLSGFLITGLLLQEIVENGRIKWLAFYSRRFKRLLPALIFMLLGSWLLVLLFLAPYEQFFHADAMQYASVWASNFFFAFSKIGYFDATAQENIFLHTWSLAVEEQFYIVWPFLLYFFLGAFQWQGGKADWKRLVWGLCGTLLICFIFGLFLSYTQPVWGFYLMPARAWQFAAGGLTFMLSHKLIFFRKDNVGNRWVSMPFIAVLLGWVAIVSLVVVAVLMPDNVVYPGFWAIIPSLATCCILLVGSIEPNSSMAKCLSLKPMQGIGRLSYSWYLWHWPILIILSENVFQWLEQAAADYQNVKTLDFNDIICPEKQCNAMQNGQIVFRDNQHLTQAYVSSLSEKVIELLE